jgi:flagellar hook-length control protein FliK
MRLSPPELGALRVEITIRDGGMTAKLEAETPQARTMLLENLPALRERLAEQDIKIERFEVDLVNQSVGGSPEQSSRGGGNGEDAAGHAATQRNRIKATAGSANEVRTQPAVTAPAGRLNVIV